MSAAHTPSPMEEAQDVYGPWWTLIHDLFGRQVAVPILDLRQFGIPFTLTRFMMVELLAAVLVVASFVWLANRVRGGELARGKGANFLEVLVLFVRDNIVRSVLGKSGDFLLPYIWTVFFFVLTCNLLGMVPLLGAPTASIWVTMTLALCSLTLMFAVPIAKMGLGNFLRTMWIPVDLPFGLGIPISILLFLLEFIGNFIKGAVLGIRLFANILVGHVVLATIVGFAGAVQLFTAWGLTVTVSSVAGAIFLSFLELFVAVLQAYVFALLTTLFIGIPLIHHAEHEHAHAHHEPDPDSPEAHTGEATHQI